MTDNFKMCLELTEELEKHKKRINKYKQKLKAKEQECEELKELVKKQKDVLIHKTILADEYEKACSFETLKVAKLIGCLNEIKEIAKINPINTCWTVLELCEKCDENKECDIQCPFFKFKLILQKISEVINE